VSKAEFHEMKALFDKYSLELTKNQFEMLQKYEQMFDNEKSIQNVTAVRDEHEIWIRHFLDSAYLLRYLPDDSEIIDIGTGGGLPGIPLAILNPTLKITLLDSELRKIEFCEAVIRKLGLQVDTLCGRAEELAQKSEYRERFDFAVSRAMANGSMLSELAFPFIKIGGKLLSMKGKNYDPSAERFESAVPQLGGTLLPPELYQIENEAKTLIAADKISSTDIKYPRRFAKIKRSPL